MNTKQKGNNNNNAKYKILIKYYMDYETYTCIRLIKSCSF